MIKETSIDDVRNAEIAQVIGHFLELKPKGSKLFAKSPFSDDKNASFCVTPSLNIFKCFSSGLGGDAIKFVQLYKRVPYFEAVTTIASICGIVLLEEEVSEDAQRKIEYKQQLYDLASSTASKYAKELLALPSNHWAQKLIVERQISQDTIGNFSIGYAPANSHFLTNPIIDKGRLELALNIGISSTKDGRSWDFFKDRLIFPIHDIKGNVVGFGGRRADDVDGPKYINTKETEIYHKSQLLYGLYQAKNAIAKSKTAILCEGYTDVTALHQNGCDIAVANCGTASLSPKQCSLLHRLANQVIICRDNDGSDLTAEGNFQKGIGAAMKDINVLLSESFKVKIVILPEGEDPDSFSRKTENITEYMLQEAQDAVIWKTLKLKNKAANDPDAISEMVTEIAQMLFCIKDDVKRNHYLDTCRKLVKQPAKVLKDKINSFIKLAEKKNENSTAVEKVEAETMGLPAGADFRQYIEMGFVTHGNFIYFRGSEKFFIGTNFRIVPLFFVKGQSEHKRICEIIFENGKKRVVDFDVDDFVQMSRFESKLLEIDSLFFTPDVSVKQFKLFKNSILKNFIITNEVKTLGWNDTGFWAYSNMIFFNGNKKQVNNYGIVQLDAVKKEEVSDEEKEYFDDVVHYYLPSSSVMYKIVREGDDPYENDRYLEYKEAPVTFNDWMRQMHKVYDKKSLTAISFCIASLFKDIFMSKYDYFPILFLSGEKGSGKTIYSESICSLFTFNQKSFDLNASTPVAFHRRLGRMKNCPTALEEFNDGLPDTIFQSIKGSYNGFGREMGKATGDNRTQVTKVNCSLILLSQYLSSRDDNSITSRSIIEHFIKPTEAYTNEQSDNYLLLKNWQKVGLNSLLCEILIYRDKIEAQLQETYKELIESMKKALKAKEYQERMLQNYVALLCPIKILEPFFNFPFTFDEIYKQFKEAIIDSSDLIIESEGLAEFWRVLEFLLDKHLIKTGKEFKIDKPIDISLQGRKGEASIPWKNENNIHVLFLRLNAVQQLYHKEVSTREGMDVIGEATMKNYFKSKKYFIGSVKSMRFEDTSTSAYAFNYDMMYEMGIVNLTRSADEYKPNGLFPKEEEEDNLPY